MTDFIILKKIHNSFWDNCSLSINALYRPQEQVIAECYIIIYTIT